MKCEYPEIRQVLQQNLTSDEDPIADRLMKEFHVVRERGYFTRDEFLKMCNWKSFRPRRLYESNPAAQVERVSRELFVVEDETARMQLLTSLQGVGVPMGSAILTLVRPDNYGVLDIRVWKLLHKFDVVKVNAAGTNFSIKHWITFLDQIRDWAKQFRVTPRAIELSLFEYHKQIQEGTLYG